MNERSKQLLEDKKYGQEILVELFKLNDAKLKAKLKDIVGCDVKNQELFGKVSQCKRIICDQEPESIELWYHDGLIIDNCGIYFKPEHNVEYQVVKFNKNFKL